MQIIWVFLGWISIHMQDKLYHDITRKNSKFGLRLFLWLWITASIFLNNFLHDLEMSHLCLFVNYVFKNGEWANTKSVKVYWESSSELSNHDRFATLRPLWLLNSEEIYENYKKSTKTKHFDYSLLFCRWYGYNKARNSRPFL